MFRTLIKTTTVAVRNREYAIRFFEIRTLRGAKRFSADIALGPDDRVILDDDSLSNLETRAAHLVPATLASRTLMKTA